MEANGPIFRSPLFWGGLAAKLLLGGLFGSEFATRYFAPFVAERLGAAAVAGPFVDQCHFCHTIMSEPAPAEVVRTAVKQLRRDLSALRWDLAGLLDHAPA